MGPDRQAPANDFPRNGNASPIQLHSSSIHAGFVVLAMSEQKSTARRFLEEERKGM
jgi:hypothetical protein